MKEQTIQVQKKEKRAILRLNNPLVSFLNLSLMDKMNKKLTQIEMDEMIRVVILTGSGKFFVA